MTTKEIKDAIITSVGRTSFSSWVIGITTDPAGRKVQHGSPACWKQWTADSLDVARAVETYFLNDYPAKASERMKGGTGGDMDEKKTAYVYIY